ncbi:MAG: 50S ribosomal protein L17 [Chitinophagales bacterium]|nr:50S ribosomal protein L17 [Chitinophagales bacterium]
MRHGNKINHLGRKYGHRSALLKNLSSALIVHKRIETTLAKAKELRKYVEPIITKAKENTTHNRRLAFSGLQNKEAAKELFDVVAPKVGDRPGGYTRIIRLGARLGDNAEMAIIELVDFNETYNSSADVEQKKTRRSRRGGKTATKKEEPKVEEKVEEVEVVEEPTQEENNDNPQA